MNPRRVLRLVVAILLPVSSAHAQETLQPLPPAPAPAEPPPVVSPSPAPSPPAADSAPPPPTTPQEDDGTKEHLSVRGTGGFQYEQVHGVPVTGARVRLGVGIQSSKIAHYANLSVLYGGTEAGLRTWDFRLGYVGDLARFSVLRVGVAAEAGYLVIRRTTIDSRMWALGVGGGVHLGADLFSWGPHDDHAITAEARFDAHLHFGAAVVWGPTISLGFRY